MTSNITKFFLFLCVCFSVLLTLTGCSKQAGQSSAATASPEVPKTEVVVDNVGQDDAQVYIYTDGVTVPYKSVDIRARVAGYLQQLFFESGGFVKEGDRLALIEQDQYKVALDAAKAELANSEARALLAEANLGRAKVLLESNATSPEEFQSRQAERDMALAAVEIAKTAVRRAELDLQYTDISSPIPGKASKNFVDIGNYISPGSTQAVLLSIAQMDPIYIDFKLSDRQFTDLKDRIGFREAFDKAVETPDAAAKIPAENGERRLALKGGKIDVSLQTGVNVLDFNFPVKGEIVAIIDNQINPDSAQVTLRAEAKNPLLKINNDEEFMLYPGQICRVRILYDTLRGAVLIREEAILTDLDTKYVLVVSKGLFQPTDRFNLPLKGADGKPVPPYETDVVKRQDIKIGRLLDSQLRVVTEGLQPGEHYIVKGVQRVRIGMEVKPITLQEYDERRAAESGTKVKDN